MKNKIEDLRNHLFATLEALQDDEKPMEIERAKAVADVARVIVETAKAEIAFANVLANSPQGIRATGFMQTELPGVTGPRLASGAQKSA